MAETEPFSLAQFVAQETQLFYQRLHEAVQKHEESGEVPPSLFGQKAIRALKKAGGRRKGAAGDAPKRKPSVFNLYIKEKLEEMNAQPALSTVPYKEKFRQVVAQWSKLNDGEKNKYKDKYAAQLAGEEPAKPTPAKRSASSSDDESVEEEKKKKKKKEKVSWRQESIAYFYFTFFLQRDAQIMHQRMAFNV